MLYFFFFSMTSFLLACGGEKADCEEGHKQCTEDDLLQVCTVDGWEDEQDCVAEDMICHSMEDATASHCMAEGAMDNM